MGRQDPGIRFKEGETCQLEPTRAVWTTQVDWEREGGYPNCTS